MPVKPPAPKHTCEDLGDKLIIAIPSPKHWFRIILMGIYTLVLAIAGLSFLGYLEFGQELDKPPILFFIIFVIFWIVFLCLMIYQLLWQIVGKEDIEITAQSIKISRVVPVLHSQKEYLASYIKELRVSSSNLNLNPPMMSWTYSYYYPWHHNAIGSLAFDYGAKTFRFGMSIDEAEAKQILAEIQQKFPQYRM